MQAHISTERKFERVDVDQVTTKTYDPENYHKDPSPTIIQKPGEENAHVELANVPLDHISPAKLVHHSSQPYSSSSALRLAEEQPKRASTFAPGSKYTSESTSLMSPESPFSPMHMPAPHRGYDSLPADDEADTEQHAATTAAGPLGDQEH